MNLLLRLIASLVYWVIKLAWALLFVVLAFPLWKLSVSWVEGTREPIDVKREVRIAGYAVKIIYPDRVRVNEQLLVSVQATPAEAAQTENRILRAAARSDDDYLTINPQEALVFEPRREQSTAKDFTLSYGNPAHVGDSLIIELTLRAGSDIAVEVLDVDLVKYSPSTSKRLATILLALTTFASLLQAFRSLRV